MFGCDLLEHLAATNQEIPQVLRCCSEFVENHGIVDGIYRLSGVSSNIQKLRSEFESDGIPDLNKDLYLQDIHCVSSLCKAYFRELPNPLLTYQLYDKFAEAVAIQLEEERLVKIRDVLKELPSQHYRTLEFLMRHLVRVASFSSETNMHARNLAIVWAPNLLRSKEIELTGFNGTAAFMEVRVQSIVVEFILTHVPQLFPEQGVSTERRKSLPSPCLLSNQEEAFFKSHPSVHIGNLSPGDGPLAMRPYHAIIEGTDKRKGSLKGRKWMSIFNIGGRFHETRRRHKHSTKEKEHPALRPARSMDSLSSPSYPDSRRPQRPPSTHLSPLTVPPPQPDTGGSAGALGASEYAVTYRRGTGVVSGGTQGTYTSLDPENLGVITTNDGVQTRSPGLLSKAGRRVAMHITGPTTVTVPLHITSNLALGVLQRGGADRIILRGRDKDAGGERERKGSEVEKMKKKDESEKLTNRKIVLALDDDATTAEKEETKVKDEAVRRQCEWEVEPETQERSQSVTSNSEQHKEEDNNDEYVDMREVKGGQYEPQVTQSGEDSVFDADKILNSTEVDDLELSDYVEDNFEFLDQMDCSVMDCSVSNQVNEFSVEPPGHSDDEYEMMEQSECPVSPTDFQTLPQTSPQRLLTVDSYKRHTKSLSLPYMTSPVQGLDESCSDEDVPVDYSDPEYSSEEDESMFVKSLPPDFFLSNTQNEEEQDITLQDQTEDQCQGFEGTQKPLLDSQPDKSEEQGEVKEEEYKKIEADKEEGTTEEDTENDHLEIDMQSTEPENGVMVEDTYDDEVKATDGCLESPLPTNDEDIHKPPDPTETNAEEEEKTDEETVENDGPSCPDDEAEPELSLVDTAIEGVCQMEEIEEVTSVTGNKENDVNMQKEQENGEEKSQDIIHYGNEIWDELEELICEVIEDEETERATHEEKDEVKQTENVEANEELQCQTNESMEKDCQTEETDEVDGNKGLKDEHLEEQSDKQEVISENQNNAKETDEKSCSAPQCVAKTERLLDEPKGGIESRVVTSKMPSVKVYQVKAVPVVPPKPQHCKLTALTIRQQQQQRERARDDPEEQQQVGVVTPKAAERWRDGDDGTRHSPLSMCFDEAVAIATMRRKENDRDRQRDWE